MAFQECNHLTVNDTQVSKVEVVDRPRVEVLIKHVSDRLSLTVDNLEHKDCSGGNATESKVQDSYEDRCFRICVKKKGKCIHEEWVDQREVEEKLLNVRGIYFANMNAGSSDKSD